MARGMGAVGVAGLMALGGALPGARGCPALSGATPRVTAVDVRVDPLEHKGDCPHLFTFRGTIKVEGGPGTIKYKWQHSDLSIPPEKTLVVDGPGAYTVESTWYLGGLNAATYDEWQKLIVLAPTRVESEPAKFHLSCRERAPDVPPPPPGAEPVVVKSVVLHAEPREYEGPCPVKIVFRGVIDVEGGPGSVTYRFTRSDRARGEIQLLSFAIPGRKVVETTWTLGRQPEGRFEGWEQLTVLTPKQMQSKPAGFAFRCE